MPSISTFKMDLITFNKYFVLEVTLNFSVLNNFLFTTSIPCCHNFDQNCSFSQPSQELPVPACCIFQAAIILVFTCNYSVALSIVQIHLTTFLIFEVVPDILYFQYLFQVFLMSRFVFFFSMSRPPLLIKINFQRGCYIV